VLRVQEVSDVFSKDQGGTGHVTTYRHLCARRRRQEVASDTADVLIKLLDMDSIDEGDPPDQWRPPDVVINNSQDFEATPAERRPRSVTIASHPTFTERGAFLRILD